MWFWNNLENTIFIRPNLGHHFIKASSKCLVAIVTLLKDWMWIIHVTWVYVFYSTVYSSGISSANCATMKQRDSDSGLAAGLFVLGSPALCALLKRQPIKSGKQEKRRKKASPGSNTIDAIPSNYV